MNVKSLLLSALAVLALVSCGFGDNIKSDGSDDASYSDSIPFEETDIETAKARIIAIEGKISADDFAFPTKGTSKRKTTSKVNSSVESETIIDAVFDLDENDPYLHVNRTDGSASATETWMYKAGGEYIAAYDVRTTDSSMSVASSKLVSKYTDSENFMLNIFKRAAAAAYVDSNSIFVTTHGAASEIMGVIGAKDTYDSTPTIDCDYKFYLGEGEGDIKMVASVEGTYEGYYMWADMVVTIIDYLPVYFYQKSNGFDEAKVEAGVTTGDDDVLLARPRREASNESNETTIIYEMIYDWGEIERTYPDISEFAVNSEAVSAA